MSTVYLMSKNATLILVGLIAKALIFLSSSSAFALDGASSTGGGNDRAEKFKLIAEIYASYLQQITAEERKAYAITVTAEDIRGAITEYTDRILELTKDQSFDILSPSDGILAIVHEGNVIEKTNPKDAYLGPNALSDDGELVIYLSLRWDPRDYTVPLKEYLRVLSKENEFLSILDFARAFKNPYLQLVVTLENINKRQPKNVVERTFKVSKLTTCVLISEVAARISQQLAHGSLEGSFRKVARDHLKRCNRIAAFEYAQRLCRSEWDTQIYRREGYLYTELVDFNMAESSCTVLRGQLRCETPWFALCRYGYENVLPPHLKDLPFEAIP